MRPDERPAAAAAPEARLAGLLTLGLLVGTVNGITRVAMPLYMAAIGALPWQVGLVGAFGYTGMLLLALPMGAWIDRHGSRPLFVRGVAVAALLYLVVSATRTPWQAIGCAVVLGLVLPLRTITAQTEFLALLPQLSSAKAGWNRAAGMLGMFFLGPAIAAAVIASLGFAPVFQLAAAGMLLALPVGARVLTVRTRPSGPVSDAPRDEGLSQRVRAQVALLRAHADVRRTMAVDFLTQAAVAYFVVFTVLLAVHRFGMSVQAAAGIVTVQGAAFVATLLAAGPLLERWREDTQVLMACVLMVAQGALFGFGVSPAALWAGAALMGVGVGLQGLTSTRRFAALMKTYGRGRVGGLTSLGPPAGGVVGAVAGGLVSQRFGSEAGFRLLALVFLLLCAAQAWRVSKSGSA